MTGVPDADAAHLPSANYLSYYTRVAQEAFSRTKRQFVDCIHGYIVANVENARTFVAGQAIHVLRTIRFSAADRSVVDGMGPRVAPLKRQSARESPYEAQQERVVRAGTDIGLLVYRTVGISCGIILIERARTNNVPRRIRAIRRRDAEVHSSARKQTNSA